MSRPTHMEDVSGMTVAARRPMPTASTVTDAYGSVTASLLGANT
jgi:hypothetical protein